MAIIDRKLPQGGIDAEVVMHVRSHLVNKLRKRSGRNVADLALLFGIDETRSNDIDLVAALGADDPVAAAAQAIAGKHGSPSQVVSFGHDARHVEECQRWLQERVAACVELRALVAFDRGTLLALSKAIDFAEASADGRPIPVIIEGPTGTGKELLAKAIHDIARRKGSSVGTFVPVQLAGQSQDHLNDELFGHTKGAFTGATNGRRGKLSCADGGTLLLDELGDMPPEAQVRLLRFLQDGEYCPLGSDKPERVKVRVIGATWHDLEGAVQQRRFREDLFYRLNGGRIRLPALSERRHTLLQVVHELLRRKGVREESPVAISASVALHMYAWPGNLRELDSVLSLAVSNSRGGTVGLEHLPSGVQRAFLEARQEIQELAAVQELGRAGASEATLQQETCALLDRLEEAIPLSSVPQVFNGLAEFINAHAESNRRDAYAVEVQQLAELHRKQSQGDAIVQRLQQLPLQDLYPPVAAAVSERLQQRIKEVERLRLERHGSGSPKFLEDPILRVWMDFKQTRLGLRVDSDKALEALMFIVEILSAVAPGFLSKVKKAAAEGGLTQVLRKISEDLNEQEPGAGQFNRPPGQPKDWAESTWRGVVRSYASKSEATRALHVDGKTISKYLRKYGIKAQWGFDGVA